MKLSFALCFSGILLHLTAQSGQIVLERIVGGRESIPHSRPYMAIIENRESCGGTLIEANWVLTAAHCPGEGAAVVLGAHSLTHQEEEKQSIIVAKQFVYPGYNVTTLEHDIMLLKLQKRAELTKSVGTIKLPSTYDDVKEGTICQVAGWGLTSNHGYSSYVLREVKVKILDRSYCEKYSTVTNNMLCAGDQRGGKDSCEGDSGGPLICNGEERGIVSFGEPGRCADHQYPGVYTRITREHLLWMKKIMTANP